MDYLGTDLAEERRTKVRERLAQKGYHKVRGLSRFTSVKDEDLEKVSQDVEKIQKKFSQLFLATTQIPHNARFLTKVIACKKEEGELYKISVCEEAGFLKAVVKRVCPDNEKQVVYRNPHNHPLLEKFYLKEEIPKKKGLRYMHLHNWETALEKDAKLIPDGFRKVEEPEDLEILYHLHYGNLEDGVLLSSVVIKACLVMLIILLVSLMPVLLAIFTETEAATIVYGGLGTAPLVLGIVALIMKIITGDQDWITNAYNGEFKTKNVRLIKAITGLDLGNISRELAYEDIAGFQVAPTNCCTVRFITNGWITVRSPFDEKEMKGMGYYKIPRRNCVFDYVTGGFIEVSGNSEVGHLETGKSGDINVKFSPNEPRSYGQRVRRDASSKMH